MTKDTSQRSRLTFDLSAEVILYQSVSVNDYMEHTLDDTM